MLRVLIVGAPTEKETNTAVSSRRDKQHPLTRNHKQRIHRQRIHDVVSSKLCHSRTNIFFHCGISTFRGHRRITLPSTIRVTRLSWELASMTHIRKRPCPVDTTLDSYKRQRLIADFENLSLTDSLSGGNLASGDNNNLGTIVPTRIQLPQSVKKKLAGGESILDHTTDRTIIYAKIRDWIKEEALQMVKWVDWPLRIYHLWMQWIQLHSEQFWRLSYDAEGDYNIDNPLLAQFDRNSMSSNDNNEIAYEDMDIDMD